MSGFFDYLYTVFTRIWNYITWVFDFLNDSIDFVSNSFSWLSGMVLNLPVAVQGVFLLAIVLGVVCLILNR